MARPLRIEYEGAFYHVTARGNERRDIYFGKTDYEKFKAYLKEAQEKYGYILHCYVLMTNHYHLLIETPMPNLKEVMHYVNGAYTNYVNIKRKRSGHLFQGRYKAILIDRDSYLLELSRYLHLNPVRVKMVEKPEDYPYSSYGVYISKNKEDIVQRDLIWGMIATKGENASRKYKDFVERVIGDELENPLKNVYGGMVLGRVGFIKDVLSRLKENDLTRKDISYRKAFKATWEAEAVIDALCAYFDSSREALLNGKRGDQRKIALYFLKKYTGITNGEIGSILGGISYSAVAKGYRRFSEKLQGDRKLKKRISEILSNVKG